ncbi:hypothetical protein [Litoribacter populi]|uniref:hypothetical protein n=1 Tax=Litoribacter populi TaxID=2598460 RepID=UPI00163D8249|nr:hypothetical protein [Litoribacter populi]
MNNLENLNLSELSLNEMVDINGGEDKKGFWDTFGGKLVMAACVALVGSLVKKAVDEIW